MMSSTGRAQAGHGDSNKGQQEGPGLGSSLFPFNFPEELTDQGESQE